MTANELIPVLEGGSENTNSIDMAFERIHRERIEEVKRIQKIQQVPPKLIFLQNSWQNCFLVIYLSCLGLVW